MAKFWGLLLLLISVVLPAHAAKPRPRSAEALSLAQTGREALASHDYWAALAPLEQAYGLDPSPDLLYDLGQVARGQGRAMAAADLWRRYLEEAGGQAEPPRRAECEQFLAGQHGPSGEVTVGGERGALLWLDERLAGALPLSLPLLVAPGEHKLRLIKDSRMVETQVTVASGRRIEVRFTLSPAVALVKLMHAVMLHTDVRGGPPDLPQRLEQTVATALSNEHAVLVRPPRLPPPIVTDKRQKNAQMPPPCPDEMACQEDLASRADAQFVLDLHVSVGPQGVRHTAILHDMAAGAPSAKAEATCDACSEKESMQKLAEMVGRLLVDGTTLARGTIQVGAASSEAQGATVKVDGRPLGTIPYERDAFAGTHAVRVERAGYVSYEERVTVEEGKPASLSVRLVKVVARPRPRPRPLRAAKWIVAGAGLLAAATGAVLWGLDGQILRNCLGSICAEKLDGLKSGLPVLVPGVVALGVGGLLFGLDARAERGTRVAALGLGILF